MEWFLTGGMILMVILLDRKLLRERTFKERRIYYFILCLFLIANIIEKNLLHFEQVSPQEWLYNHWPYLKDIYSFLEEKR